MHKVSLNSWQCCIQFLTSILKLKLGQVQRAVCLYGFFQIYKDFFLILLTNRKILILMLKGHISNNKENINFAHFPLEHPWKKIFILISFINWKYLYSCLKVLTLIIKEEENLCPLPLANKNIFWRYMEILIFTFDCLISNNKQNKIIAPGTTLTKIENPPPLTDPLAFFFLIVFIYNGNISV